MDSCGTHTTLRLRESHGTLLRPLMLPSPSPKWLGWQLWRVWAKWGERVRWPSHMAWNQTRRLQLLFWQSLLSQRGTPTFLPIPLWSDQRETSSPSKSFQKPSRKCRRSPQHTGMGGPGSYRGMQLSALPRPLSCGSFRSYSLTGPSPNIYGPTWPQLSSTPSTSSCWRIA